MSLMEEGAHLLSDVWLPYDKVASLEGVDDGEREKAADDLAWDHDRRWFASHQIPPLAVLAQLRTHAIKATGEDRDLAEIGRGASQRVAEARMRLPYLLAVAEHSRESHSRRVLAVWLALVWLQHVRAMPALAPRFRNFAEPPVPRNKAAQRASEEGRQGTVAVEGAERTGSDAWILVFAHQRRSRRHLASLLAQGAAPSETRLANPYVLDAGSLLKASPWITGKADNDSREAYAAGVADLEIWLAEAGAG